MKIVKPVRAKACMPEQGCHGGGVGLDCLSESGWKNMLACLT